MMDDRWVKRWDTVMGVAPRLRTFFSSPEARRVLREFQSCANTEGDVEVLAFLLIVYVWPEIEWKKKGPSPQRLKATARSLDQCRLRVAQLIGTGLLGSPEVVQQTCNQLQQWTTHLTAEARGWPMVSIGTFSIGGAPPAAKRHRAKRQVVFFLTHYFHTLGCPTPPWRIITRFLILAKLARSTATDQRIATWWSNVTRREHRTGGAEPLAPYQQAQLMLFEDIKNQVWSGQR
jgi:hypothetical protein